MKNLKWLQKKFQEVSHKLAGIISWEDIKEVLRDDRFPGYKKSGWSRRNRHLVEHRSPVEFEIVCRLSGRNLFKIKNKVRNMKDKILSDTEINIVNSIGKKKKKVLEEPKVKPFLKWAGGKLRVVPLLKKKFPETGGRFIEPFLGAGSVSLNVDYSKYIVNDVNADLVAVWQKFKTMGMEFVGECEKLFKENTNNRQAFDKLKEEFNQTKDKLRKATLFVYLNRHCFNGLCRYNGSGEYNVPFGKIDKPHFPREEFEKCLDRVKKFEIHNKDFREIFSMVENGDVVYCDPPYLPLTSTAHFSGYSSGGFSFKDQLQLSECADIAAKKGATVIISNHYNWYSHQIYVEMFGAKISTIDVARTISSDIEKRDAVKEILAVFSK